MKSDDKIDRLIDRMGNLVDLVAAVVSLYVLVAIAVEIGDLFGFMRTMRDGW